MKVFNAEDVKVKKRFNDEVKSKYITMIANQQKIINVPVNKRVDHEDSDNVSQGLQSRASKSIKNSIGGSLNTPGSK